MPPNATAETEGIEPPTLAGSCFQDSVLDQPDSLLRIVNQAAAARIERALTRSKRVVRTFTLRRIRFSPQLTGSRRIERRLTGSEPVVRPLHQEPVRAFGLEPNLTAWKAVVLAIEHYARRCQRPALNDVPEGRRDSNPHLWHKRKGQESNLQGCDARLFSRQEPSPIGLPFPWSCGGWDRTSGGRA